MHALQVVHKTLNPQWNQTLEFPDTGDRLVLHVKDHNALLPTSNIGDCFVEYERLPPNQTVEKWIPLQGVKSGEIHVLVTRRVPELQKKSSIATGISSLSKARKLSEQVSLLLVHVIRVMVHIHDHDCCETTFSSLGCSYVNHLSAFFNKFYYMVVKNFSLSEERSINLKLEAGFDCQWVSEWIYFSFFFLVGVYSEGISSTGVLVGCYWCLV